MPSTNNKISGLVSSQLPGFVRDDNPLFVSFMEAYYEYLEQTVLDSGSTGQGKVVERINSLKNYNNIEKTLDDFANILFNDFMQFIPQPEGTRVDFKKVLPHIKDFYRAKGSEKSYKFLLRLLSNGLDTDIFYPKDHILKPSDGKWFVERSLRITDTRLNNNLDATLATFQKYVGRVIKGLTSNTTATVERTEQFFEQGGLINEMFLSSISNTFISGETVQAEFSEGSSTIILKSNVLAGFVTGLIVNAGGTGYTIGTPLSFSGGGGSGALGSVTSVSTGNVASITIVNAGSGYQNGAPFGTNNFFLFTGGGGGSGANAEAGTIDVSGFYHPNTYNIDANQLSQIQSATWSSAQTIFAISTSNLALNVINSITSTFSYANTGPLITVKVNNPGDGYTAVPAISVVANSTVAALGILGSLIINNGGSGYALNDELVFTNPLDGYGFGAKANVRSINGSGAITQVGYYADPGEIAGGLGYFPGFLPSITVTSSGGTGANITVASPLTYGAELTSTTGAIGSILGVSLSSGGQNYSSVPSVFVSGGDGTANIFGSITQGVYTYPGYFLNQDGFPSSYNFLQDRDYWQNYSYVIRVGLAYEKWIQAVNNLLHPLGMKVWGEYAILDTETLITQNTSNPAIDTVRRVDVYNDGLSNTMIFSGNNSYVFEDGYGNSGNSFFDHSASLWINFNTYLPNTNVQATLIEFANSALGHGGTGGPNNSNTKILSVYLGRERTVMGYNEWANSETVVSSDWVLQTGITSIANAAVVAPDETTTGALIIEDTSTGVHELGRPINSPTITGSTYVQPMQLYTYSQHFKPFGNTSWVQMRWSSGLADGTMNVYFGLTSNGLIGTSEGTTRTANNARIEHVGNSWYRCEMTGMANNNPIGNVSFRMARGDTNESYTGDTSSGLYVWGSQFEPTNYQGEGPSGSPALLASRYTKTSNNAPQVTYATDAEELSGTGHYIGVNFSNNRTGALLYHARSDSVSDPLQTNTWYHVLVGINTKSPTGPFFQGMSSNSGIYLNNVASTKVIKTTHNFQQHTSNLNSHATTGNVILFSLGANTTGQNTYTGNIAYLWWRPYGGMNIASVNVRRAFLHTNSFAPNLDIMIGGTSTPGFSNAAQLETGQTTGAKFYFRANSLLSLTALGASVSGINSGIGNNSVQPILEANATNQAGIFNAPMTVTPNVTFGGGPGSSLYY